MCVYLRSIIRGERIVTDQSQKARLDEAESQPDRDNMAPKARLFIKCDTPYDALV